jgi:hypothetical protein
MFWTELWPIAEDQWVRTPERLRFARWRVGEGPKGPRIIGIRHDTQHWRYRLCWDYLRVSPSYWLVHQAANGRIRISGQQRTSLRLADVQKTYELMGDVYSKPFGEWFKDHARSAFGLAGQAEAECLANWPAIKNLNTADFAKIASKSRTWAKSTLGSSGDCAALVLIVPATKRYTGSVGYVRNLLKQHWASLLEEREIPYTIHTESKQRLEALWQNLALLRLVAEHWEEEWWRIGARFAKYQWQSEFAAELDSAAPRNPATPLERNWRHRVGIQIDRKLNYALRVAENAARGEFPSNNPLAAAMSWDFEDGKFGNRLLALR